MPPLIEWVKVFHLVFVVTWFAGLFYLPRLFVYHAEATDRISLERFRIMEHKLFWYIMTPSALLTVLSGAWMTLDNASLLFGRAQWLYWKLALVLLLIGYHVYCGRLLRLFREGRNPFPSVFYRWFNELPTLVLIAVMILAVLKPF